MEQNYTLRENQLMTGRQGREDRVSTFNRNENCGWKLDKDSSRDFQLWIYWTKKITNAPGGPAISTGKVHQSLRRRDLFSISKNAHKFRD